MNCKIDDCERIAKVKAEQLCDMHYQRLRRTGTTDPRPSYRRKKVSVRNYVHVWMPDHPKAYSNGRIAEHHLVMEKVLGRHLYPGESVHHKNGVQNDNRPENLELWVKAQPAGQRPEDLVAWAREILERYGDA